ncbi:hypothetical protein CkaCkLH20_05421 [Colletotrichum karsti]|uniref:Transmembrane protein n=1 Tax=Colletotrichum karsti TaxID=1095194 RepID=A0A9P6LLF0_9PEZI|nr:uncharacterized protein CkaCkLH20_05421 [Colletotrichum karsti]KAF9877155.1 hypothetical protein CkaCkLH20_05421 [Colletotrichum karsti]
MLATKTRRFPVHAAAGVWLCTIIAAQIGMALLGLCYSVEDQDALALVVTEGKVSVPDMSSIQTAKIVNGPSSPEAEEYTANNYGQISLAFTTGTPDDHPEIGTIWTPSNPLMFCGVDYCDYIFHEESVDSSVDNGNGGEDQDEDSTPPKTLVVTTDRNIVSTATCHSWRVVKGASGNETIITIDTTADDITNRDKNVTIPVRGGVNQTTYMTDNSENCGAGCRLVNAFEVSDAAAWYYSCNVTVSRVANGTIPEHEVSESLRSMAAASIALQGSAVLSLDNDNIQYQIYPSESIFGLPNLGQNSSMAMVMARFAIGTVAVAAHANDPIVVNGFAPVEGSHVVIDHWDYAILILNSVVFAQFVLGVATAVVASRVVIPEGGPIAMAQVLRAIADRVQGCDGDDAMSSGGEGGVWIYKAVKTAEKGTYDLYMEERPCGPNNTHSMELS